VFKEWYVLGHTLGPVCSGFQTKLFENKLLIYAYTISDKNVYSREFLAKCGYSLGIL